MFTMLVKKTSSSKTKQPMVITDTPGSSFDKIAMNIRRTFKPEETTNIYLRIYFNLARYFKLAS